MSDARRRGRPPASNTAATRARIIDAAKVLFGRDGFDATTMAAIGDRAGMTAGSLYHHFASKEDLYAAVAREIDEELLDAFNAAVAAHQHLGDRLRALVATCRRLQEVDPDRASFFVAVGQEVRRHRELARSMSPHHRRYAAFFSDLAETAAAQGDLPEGLEPSAVAATLRALFAGLAQASVAVRRPEQFARMMDVFEVVLAGGFSSPLSLEIKGGYISPAAAAPSLDRGSRRGGDQDVGHSLGAVEPRRMRDPLRRRGRDLG
jgi:AcrR family transcriptional regulator